MLQVHSLLFYDPAASTRSECGHGFKPWFCPRGTDSLPVVYLALSHRCSSRLPSFFCSCSFLSYRLVPVPALEKSMPHISTGQDIASAPSAADDGGRPSGGATVYWADDPEARPFVASSPSPAPTPTRLAVGDFTRPAEPPQRRAAGQRRRRRNTSSRTGEKRQDGRARGGPARGIRARGGQGSNPGEVAAP